MKLSVFQHSILIDRVTQRQTLNHMHTNEQLAVAFKVPPQRAHPPLTENGASWRPGERRAAPTFGRRTHSSKLRLLVSALFYHRVHERADAASNPDAHVVATFEVHRRLLDKADALRGSSHDDGTREESRSLGEEGDSLADVEDLVAERRRWLQMRKTDIRRSG